MKQLGIPIKGTSEIYIGLDLFSAVSLFEDEDIIKIDDMGNGYTWLKCWIYPFGQRILCLICFKDGFAVEIKLYPYINCITGNESWDEASEEKMIFDKEFCERWLAEHNVAFLEKATVVTDIRSLSAGKIKVEEIDDKIIILTYGYRSEWGYEFPLSLFLQLADIYNDSSLLIPIEGDEAENSGLSYDSVDLKKELGYLDCN